METSEQIMELRPREESREIAGNFRFRPNGDSERVAEQVAINRGTKLPKSIRFNASKRSSLSKMSPSALQSIEVRAN